jgi:endonuclease G
MFPIVVSAQDTIRVKHVNYESVFSKKLRYPILVQWTVEKNEIVCKSPIKRSDIFTPDPQLPTESNVGDDYIRSGFDRGHISPAADARCSNKAMHESFYYTNMAPQYPGLNRGQWKVLEEWTREAATRFDSVKVSAGCVGKTKTINKVSVPSHCWKVVTIPSKKQTIGYVFPNIEERSASFEMHKVSLDSIRQLTGFTFR